MAIQWPREATAHRLSADPLVCGAASGVSCVRRRSSPRLPTVTVNLYRKSLCICTETKKKTAPNCPEATSLHLATWPHDPPYAPHAVLEQWNP
eukprot:306516-Rhodomonas_salina.2